MTTAQPTGRTREAADGRTECDSREYAVRSAHRLEEKSTIGMLLRRLNRQPRMSNWGFADGNGDTIARGWQGTERQARAQAQVFADARRTSVDFWDESDKTGADGEGEPAESLETVEPAES